MLPNNEALSTSQLLFFVLVFQTILAIIPIYEFSEIFLFQAFQITS